MSGFDTKIPSADRPAAPAPRWRRYAPRLSLRSMLLLVFVVASGYGLWSHRHAWAPSLTLRPEKGRRFIDAGYAESGRLIRTWATGVEGSEHQLWDAADLRQIRTMASGDSNDLPASSNFKTSADGTRIITTVKVRGTRVYDAPEGKQIAVLRGDPVPAVTASFSPAGDRILVRRTDGAVRIWSRRRPEWWWGYAWLKEFWFTFGLAAALTWSVWRDRRAIRAAAA